MRTLQGGFPAWRRIAIVREVREAGSDPSFLLKALGEASGELRRQIYGLSRRDLRRRGPGFDEDWSLLAIAFHMREAERGFLRQLTSMLTEHEPEIPHVDVDDIPFEEDWRDADEDELLEEFHYLRRRTSYLLWDLPSSDWERGGLHPYRGRVTVIQLAREIYQHDLEHLWQSQRMLEAAAGARA